MAPLAKASHGVTRPHARPRTPAKNRSRRFQDLSTQSAKELFDRQARKYLGMSGEEFRRRYQARTLSDYDESDVMRVAMLMPFDQN